VKKSPNGEWHLTTGDHEKAGTEGAVQAENQIIRDLVPSILIKETRVNEMGITLPFFTALVMAGLAYRIGKQVVE
jgi:hypothetical protein